MRRKLRLTVTPETINDETRYYVVDHTGRRWFGHDERSYAYSIPYGMETNEQRLTRWKEITSATPELALEGHAPNSDDYDIIPAKTKLVKIRIDLLSTSSERTHPDPLFFAIWPTPPLNLRPQAGEYYCFTTLDDVQEMFLYSDIKHISFEDI